MRAWILRNLGFKLLSLGLAIFLWIVVLGEQKAEVSVTLPLALDVPADVVLVNDPPDSLEILLRGPKTLVTSLASREVALDPVPVKVGAGEHFLPVRTDLVRVPRGIQVVGVTPQRIRIVLEAMAEREVEIAPRVEGALPPGFAVRRVVSAPPRVRIVGPSSEVRRLARVRTLPVSLEGHTTTFSTRVLLEPAGRLIRIQDPTPVMVEVEIDARRP